MHVYALVFVKLFVYIRNHDLNIHQFKLKINI